MKYKVLYLPSANRDVIAIYDYIAVQLSNKKAADDFIDDLERKNQIISENPALYRKYERLDLNAEEVRVAPIKNYFMFYSIQPKAKVVEVKRVIYQRRDIESIYEHS